MRTTLLLLVVAVGFIAVAMGLGGNSVALRRQFYQCQVESLKRFPDDPGGPVSKTAAFLEDCMGAAGYEVGHRENTFCVFGDPARRLQEFCYAPIGRLSRWLQDADIWFTRRTGL